jgi:hypothetical protein
MGVYSDRCDQVCQAKYFRAKYFRRNIFGGWHSRCELLFSPLRDGGCPGRFKCTRLTNQGCPAIARPQFQVHFISSFLLQCNQQNLAHLCVQIGVSCLDLFQDGNLLALRNFPCSDATYVLLCEARFV